MKRESPGADGFSGSHRQSYSVTSLGRTMAGFPLAPRYAKMLSIAEQHGCLPYVIALVSALSVREVFVSGGGGEEEESAAVMTDRWTKLYRSLVRRVRRLWEYVVVVLFFVVHNASHSLLCSWYIPCDLCYFIRIVILLFCRHF